MAENTLLEKVLSLQDKYKKLEEQLADPEVIGDMKKFVQLNKDYKELQPIIAAGLEYKRLVEELAQAKDILMNEKDEDLKEMAKDEIAEIEDALDTVWPMLSASAQSVIDKQGVAYTDKDGELVTSIVRGKDCVFTCYQGDNCLCALEKAAREKAANGQFIKPISCALYPIREKRFADGLVGLNYHRWDVCRDAINKGKALNLPLYRFLKEPLIRRFGQEWYDELCEVAAQLTNNS